MMDELEFPDFGGEVTPVAPFGRFPYGEDCCQRGRCDDAQFVLGTELGLVIEDCDGVQLGVDL